MCFSHSRSPPAAHLPPPAAPAVLPLQPPPMANHVVIQSTPSVSITAVPPLVSPPAAHAQSSASSSSSSRYMTRSRKRKLRDDDDEDEEDEVRIGFGLSFARWQNLIPSFLWIVPPRPPPWRLAQSKERKGSNFAA